jgi:methionine-rich copper-binding protein CopC
MTDTRANQHAIRATSFREAMGRACYYTVEALEHRTLFASLTIAQENQLPGSPPSQWDVSGAGDLTLQGFATEMSVNRGEVVKFKVTNTALAPHRVEIYRMGYYQGNGARLVSTISDAQTREVNQPAPLSDPNTGLVDAGNWSETASWQVPADATSGIYFARLVREDTGGASHIVFVVRNDEGRSDMLFQTADTTWQAYNSYGGNSLYAGTSEFGPRGVKVSYNRPLTVRGVAGGLGSYNSPFHAEYPMVRWLERNGYDVSYFSNIDTERYGSEIREHKAFLSVGHDEYWSAGMRANVEAARDAGVHLGFFSGNEVFWKVRWEDSIDASGAPYRTLVCYKESREGVKIDPTPAWTGTWRDERLSPPYDGGRPENALTGTIYMNDRTNVDIGINMQVPSTFADLRFWRNTSVADLADGQTATVGDRVVGYETNEDLDNGFRPAGLIRMSSTTFTTDKHVVVPWGTTVGPGTSTHNITLYRASGGALVFSAGSIQWSWGLDGQHINGASAVSPAMQQATVNLFADMGVQPATLQSGLIRAAMTADVSAPTSAITSPTSSVTVGVPVTVKGTATDAGGGTVGGVEISVDGGRTWRRAEGTDAWTYSWTPSNVGPTTLLSRAADDSANIQTQFVPASINVLSQPTSTTGLVGAWSFNAGAGTSLADSSGRGNNGTVSGATWATGFFGGGLRFDGVDDWVTVNDAASLDLTNGMTLEAWVRPTAGDWRNVIIKERPDGLAYALYSSNSSGVPEADVHISGDQSVVAEAEIPMNQWAHLAATYDGQAVTLYVNGTPAGTRNAPGNVTASTSPLRFGGNSVWGEFFQGVIDEIRIYNRPLSQGEINVDLSTPIGGSLENVPPTVSVSAPASGSSVSGDATLTATASDNVGIAQVEFLVNGATVGTPDSTSPYTFTWRTAQIANGAYTITARARDRAGNATTSAPITLNVNNAADQVAPTATLMHPPGGSRVSGSVALWATASDNIGVAGVQFQVDGVDVGPADSTSPYQFLLDTQTLADGDHTITAIARDAAGNRSVPSPLTVTVENSPPVLLAHSPPSGAASVAVTTDVEMTFNEDIDPASIVLDVRNPAGQRVPGSITYDVATNTARFHPSITLSVGTTYDAALTVARDLAGNAMASPATWSFTTNSVATNVSIWQPNATPTLDADQDNRAIELGLRFQAEVNGYVTGVRFYKGAGNTGTHVGRLWTNDGQLLGSVTFADESATGWQQATFGTPIAVTAGTTYLVSYSAPFGHYSATAGYFTSSGYDGGILDALPNSEGGANGVYRYGSGGVFPTASFNATNYWVDVVFTNSLLDASPASVAARTPASGATGVDVHTNVTARFSEAVQPDTVSMVLRDAGGNEVPSSITYDSTTFTAALNPSVALAHNTNYTATVSGAADASNNVMAPTTWSFTTAVTPDLAAPTVSSQSPPAGATNVLLGSNVTATFDEDIDPSTLVFELRNAANQLVSANVSYHSVSRTATLDPAAALAFSSDYSASVRASDLSGNPMSGPAAWSFTTEAVVMGATIWPSSAVPASPAENDPSAAELGVKFRAASDGYITGIRFYKGTGNTGTHVGHLWNAAGALLATVTFVDESETGWQHADFDVPVAIVGGQTYVASYFAPAGHYAANVGYFSSASVTTGPLTALRSGIDGGNGVFRYGATGGVPTTSHQSTNYWVDVVYNNALPIDDTAPTIVPASRKPADETVHQGTNVTATFSERVAGDTISMVLRDASNNVVDGVVSYNELTRAVTFDPTGPLAANSTFTVTIEGAADNAGNVMDGVSWSFTVAAPLIGQTIWSEAQTPTTLAYNDASSVEVGVKFRAASDGYITGIRFYKGAGNNGTHVGNLWDASGNRLATVTFAEETASGWQQAEFSSPVAISAGQTYTASYYAPVGRYSADRDYFATSGTTSGPLTALRNDIDGGNGVFRYGTGGGFPSNSFQSTNYWVDVVFASTPDDLTPPTVKSFTPAAGATVVGIGSNVTATFKEAVQAGTISMELHDGANNLIPADVTYDAATKTVTLNPTANLARDTTYTVTLSGARDAAGNLMQALTWSFTSEPRIVGATVWPSTATPATLTANDPSAVEVGMKFRSSVDGFITGIRFYKGTTNTGTHVGHLWSSTGTLLATVTFTNESASGWQQATFSAPVAVVAGRTYVASYFAPVGRYSVNGAYFSASGTTNGPLTALRNGTEGGNGVYRYGAGGGFPTSSFNASNYWVDVVFANEATPAPRAAVAAQASREVLSPSYLSDPSDGTAELVVDSADAAGLPTDGADTVAPTISGRTPDGSTDVAPRTPPSVTFSEPVVPRTISLRVLDQDDREVKGTVNYDEATRTATFLPLPEDGSPQGCCRQCSHCPLRPSTTYRVMLSGAEDLAGNVMSSTNWSFTTSGVIANATLWSNSDHPTAYSLGGAGPTEVGVEFQVIQDGYITGLRFYKPAGSTGVHVAHLWDEHGTPLATATFTSETDSGWQQLNFREPVLVSGNTTYVASYYAPDGGYAMTENYFGPGGYSNGAVRILAPAASGGGGGMFYHSAGGAFPATHDGKTNYWVDVVFANVPLTVVEYSGGPLGNDLSLPGAVSAVFSTDVIAPSLEFVVRDDGGQAVEGTVEYQAASNRAIFRPAAGFSGAGTFTATVNAVDVWGNIMTPFTWAFTLGDANEAPPVPAAGPGAAPEPDVATQPTPSEPEPPQTVSPPVVEPMPAPAPAPAPVAGPGATPEPDVATQPTTSEPEPLKTVLSPVVEPMPMPTPVRIDPAPLSARAPAASIGTVIDSVPVLDRRAPEPDARGIVDTDGVGRAIPIPPADLGRRAPIAKGK